MTNHSRPLYSCNHFTLKMATTAVQTCWWGKCD